MNERAVFEKAVEIQNPAQRQAFLAQVCGQDSALRARVEALLTAHEAAGSFLGIPAVEQVQPGAAQPLPRTQDLGKQAEAEFELSSAEACRAVLDLLQPSTKPDSLGVLGHYEVLQVLGQGGFGIVLKAFDEKLHRLVAIKMMTPQMAATSPPRKRFLREARAVAAMRHENIVQVYSVEEQPLPYLVMECIAGETLQQKMDQAGPLDTAEILHIGRQIASGLAAAHATGMIHRDIKPGNILLEQGVERRVKITDFGLARATDDASMTRSGVVSGTPMYMAPEQASGQALDQRTDLFSLGSVLYQMACGRPPFRASNTLAVLRRVAEDAPRPLQEILPEVPDFLAAIIAKLHAKQPVDRFQSAKELADLLSRCQAELQSGGKVTYAAKLLPPSPSIEEIPTSTPTQPATEPASKPDVGKSHRANNRGLAIAASLLLALAAVFALTEATGVTRWTRLANRQNENAPHLVAESAANSSVGKIPLPSDGSRTAEPSAATGEYRPVNVTVPQGEAPYVDMAPGKLADRARPFVVTRPDDTQRGEYAFLWEAISFLEDGGVITVFGNGPFEVGRVQLNERSLRLRAAPGYRPRFVPTSKVSQHEPWFVISGGCDIAGCDFETPTYFIMFQGGSGWPWQFVNCRFLGNFIKWVDLSGPKLTVTDCLIARSVAGAEPVITSYQGIGGIEVRNNIVFATGGQLLSVPPAAPPTHVSLTHNTLRIGSVMEIDRNPNIHVLHATGNVFSGVDLQFNVPQTPAEQRSRHIWIGADNIYSGPRREQLSSVDIDSQNVERLKFQYAARFDDDPAGASHVKPDLDRLRQKHHLPELGPDLDLIGPGEAYVRALERASGNPIPKDELRPSPTADGPFVLLREGKLLSGHLALHQAMASVQDGDIIEIRGDGPYPANSGDNHYQAKPGTRLTIRSAPGYRPVLEGPVRFETGFELTIEGIHFRNLNDTWRSLETVAAEIQIDRDAHIARLANCSFESVMAECTRIWCHSPNEEPAEIVNCLIRGIPHVALTSGGRKLVVRNCVSGPIYVSRTNDGGEASLHLEETALLNPAYSWSQGEAINVVAGRGALAGSAKDCLIECGPNFSLSVNQSVRLAKWYGNRCIYRSESGPLIPRFREQYQSTEEGSIDEDPIHYDPQAWRLVAGSPGQGTLRGGRDVGANVDRIARPTLATPAPLTPEARKGLEWVLSTGGHVRFYGQVGPTMYRQGGVLPEGPVALYDLHSGNADAVNDTTIENLRDLVFVRNDGYAAVNLPGTSITDVGIAKLASYPGLAGIKDMNLSRTGISDAGLGDLSRFRNLQSLSLIGTNISDAGLANLRGLPLVGLRLDDCKSIDGSGLVHLRHLPALREMNVVGCSISDDKLAALRGLPLTYLEVKNVGDVGLEHLVELPKLQTLRLQYGRITDEGLGRLQKLSDLRSLSIGASPNITDAGLEHLSRLNTLTNLYVCGTKVTKAGVEKLAAALPNCKIESDHGNFGP